MAVDARSKNVSSSRAKSRKKSAAKSVAESAGGSAEFSFATAAAAHLATVLKAKSRVHSQLPPVHAILRILHPMHSPERGGHAQDKRFYVGVAPCHGHGELPVVFDSLDRCGHFVPTDPAHLDEIVNWLNKLEDGRRQAEVERDTLRSKIGQLASQNPESLAAKTLENERLATRVAQLEKDLEDKTAEAAMFKRAADRDAAKLADQLFPESDKHKAAVGRAAMEGAASVADALAQPAKPADPMADDLGALAVQLKVAKDISDGLKNILADSFGALTDGITKAIDARRETLFQRMEPLGRVPAGAAPGFVCGLAHAAFEELKAHVRSIAQPPGP